MVEPTGEGGGRVGLSILFSRIELLIAVLALLWAVNLHVIVLNSSEALWRDEAGTVHMAADMSLPDLWDHLDRDTCPFLWFMILKLWCNPGFGSGDQSLRIMGFIVGLGLLSMVWFTVRRLGARSPSRQRASVKVNGFNALSTLAEKSTACGVTVYW